MDENNYDEIPDGEYRAYDTPMGGKQTIENRGIVDVPVRVVTAAGSEIAVTLHPGAILKLTIHEGLIIYLEKAEHEAGLRLVDEEED